MIRALTDEPNLHSWLPCIKLHVPTSCNTLPSGKLNTTMIQSYKIDIQYRSHTSKNPTSCHASTHLLSLFVVPCLDIMAMWFFAIQGRMAMVMSMLCCISMAFQRSGPVKARFVNMGAGKFGQKNLGG